MPQKERYIIINYSERKVFDNDQSMHQSTNIICLCRPFILPKVFFIRGTMVTMTSNLQYIYIFFIFLFFSLHLFNLIFYLFIYLLHFFFYCFFFVSIFYFLCVDIYLKVFFVSSSET